MPGFLINTKSYSKKHKAKFKQELNKTQSNLPRNLQAFINKLLSGNGFIHYN